MTYEKFIEEYLSKGLLKKQKTSKNKGTFPITNKGTFLIL